MYPRGDLGWSAKATEAVEEVVVVVVAADEVLEREVPKMPLSSSSSKSTPLIRPSIGSMLLIKNTTTI
mgnify:CR=1 FL=1